MHIPSSLQPWWHHCPSQPSRSPTPQCGPHAITEDAEQAVCDALGEVNQSSDIQDMPVSKVLWTPACENLCLQCKIPLTFKSESSAFRVILISPPCPCLMGQDANFGSSGPTHALVIRSFITTFHLNSDNTLTPEKDQMTTKWNNEQGRILSYLNLGKGTSHKGIYLLKETLAASNCFTVVGIQCLNSSLSAVNLQNYPSVIPWFHLFSWTRRPFLMGWLAKGLFI